jgi:hypothetical protein
VDLGTGIAIGTGTLALFTAVGSLVSSWNKNFNTNLLESTALAQTINTSIIKSLRDEVKECENDKEKLTRRVEILESLVRGPS